jgi:hypothetical protein
MPEFVQSITHQQEIEWDEQKKKMNQRWVVCDIGDATLGSWGFFPQHGCIVTQDLSLD